MREATPRTAHDLLPGDTAPVRDFARVLRPCRTTNGWIFVRVQYAGGTLSLVGVEGPKANGDCAGSAGQVSAPVTVREYGEGWTAEAVARLWSLWGRWHLNDLRAACEHQRALGWSERARQHVEVTHYGLTSEAHRLRTATLDAAARAALAGEPFTPSPAARALASDPHWFRERFTPPDADSPLSGCYEVRKRETVALASLYCPDAPSNTYGGAWHPDGLLCRPCPECGYRYGSAWLREEVPAAVLAELQSLPASPVPCPWRNL